MNDNVEYESNMAFALRAVDTIRKLQFQGYSLSLMWSQRWGAR